ncbi:glycosyltransferase [Candidatus Pelagibacter sp.]|nr:glycosyltransferase [Candidatus Pelagibacter sp.]
MKIYYWCPYLTNIATIKSVLRSAKSLLKNNKIKNINEVAILNSSGEWDFQKRNSLKIKIMNLYPFSFHKFLPKEGFIQSRISFLIILFTNFFPLILKIKKEKPKYLIVHLLTILPIILSPFLSKNTKIILRISGLPKLTILRILIWRLFSKYIYKVTAPTEKTLEMLKKSKIFNKNKIILLRDPAIDKNEIFKNKKIKLPKKFKNKKFILSIGRLTNQKNFEFLIKMFAKHKKIMGSDYLLIIGEGEEKTKLQKIINYLNCSESIFLLGFQKNVYNYINNCQTLISTAEYEDPGFSLLEAAYLKKKIITSLVDNGPKDMKKNGDLCYFFNFNNEKSFLKAVKNSKNKNILKINNAQKYSENFSILSHSVNLQKILK